MAWLSIPLPAAAQDSRADENRQKQAAKAATVSPPQHNIAERVIKAMKRFGVLGRPTGLHPVATSVYPGGWIAFGAGYRQPFLDSGTFKSSAAWSLQNCRGVSAELRLPSMSRGRMKLALDTRWLTAPGMSYYGIGNDTQAGDEVPIDYSPFEGGVSATFSAARRLTLGAGSSYFRIAQGPTYMRTAAFAEYDWRETPGYTGSGGLYRVELREHSELTSLGAGFRSIEVEVAQLVPIWSANWAIALRGAAGFSHAQEDAAAPVHLLQSLGGNNSLRGYPSFRFRDNHKLLLSAEYRWTPSRILDMAIFYDTGRVAARVADLGLTDLKSSYGIGARFHGTSRTVLRLELAKPDHGPLRFVFATGTAF